MKLLFDQNISFRLIKRIVALFPNSKQVRELGLETQPTLRYLILRRKINFQ